MPRIMNFNAGPAALPLAALERAQQELTDFAASGMSVMEHSHRGKEYEKVHDEGSVADYVVTGAWGEKALSEAKAVAHLFDADVHVACSTGTGEGKEKSYVRAPLPSEVNPTPRAAYLHCTSNETIHGVEFEVDPARPFPPIGGAPLVFYM